MDNSHEELWREFQQICRQVGLKATTPRFYAYRFLKGNLEHPAVDRVREALQEELPSISRESVHRILNDFASKGLIGILNRSDVVARFDSNPNRHDHFVCDRCGVVYDFDCASLPATVEPFASPIGRCDRVEARVRGVCRRCLEEEEHDAVPEDGDERRQH